jgi:hypothetical protein
MPTASDRPKSGKANRTLGGSATASNDTPVSTAEQPDPLKHRATKARAMRPDFDPPPIDTNPAPNDHSHATGHDHPSQSEHDHKRQKFPGKEPAHRLQQDANRRKFDPKTELRQKGSRGAKPSQKSKGR